MDLTHVSAYRAVALPPNQIPTPESFHPIFDILSAQKVDHLLTRFAYEVDWDHSRKVTLNVVAYVKRTKAHIIGYYPVAGVTHGVYRLSIGLVKLSLSLAALGAYSMVGIPSPQNFQELLRSSSQIAEGALQLLPLTLGAGVYIVDHTPSLEIYVQSLRVSQDKWGVISDYIHEFTSPKASEACEPPSGQETYADDQSWTKQLVCGIEKTYTLATDGAECIVTCAAWGNLILGAGALVAAPLTGASSVPYALTSLTKGALALGALGFIDADLTQRATSYLFPKQEIPIDRLLDQLVYDVRIKNIETLGEIYQALSPELEPRMIEIIAPLPGTHTWLLSNYLPWPFAKA